jgi:hypothetical protein
MPGRSARPFDGPRRRRCTVGRGRRRWDGRQHGLGQRVSSSDDDLPALTAAGLLVGVGCPICLFGHTAKVIGPDGAVQVP